jgi:peptidyl-prolyl isomerase D
MTIAICKCSCSSLVDRSRFPLLTNAALAALKATPAAGHLAVTLTTRALALSPLSDAEKAKALYRRALGKVVTKDDDEAEKDLRQALTLAPGDGGVTKALREVETRRTEKKEREKKAYAKMFA